MAAIQSKKEVSLSINHDKSITVNTVTFFIENGKTVSKSVDRTNYPPTHDIADLPEDAKDIAKLIWTDEAKEIWASQFDLVKG